MIYYFYLIAFISLYCLGLRAITDNGMIGYPIRAFFKKYFPSAGKPIVLCSTCMSSFWGTIIFWYFTPFSLDNVFLWIATCISASFVNSVCWAYYESICNCKE